MNRETPIETIFDQDDKLQFDGKDDERILDTAQLVTASAVNLIESLAQYRDFIVQPATETSAEEMKEIRKELIAHWASAQMALSAVAFTFRFEGDVAYNRLVYACTHEGETSDMSGL